MKNGEWCVSKVGTQVAHDTAPSKYYGAVLAVVQSPEQDAACTDGHQGENAGRHYHQPRVMIETDNLNTSCLATSIDNWLPLLAGPYYER